MGGESVVHGAALPDDAGATVRVVHGFGTRELAVTVFEPRAPWREVLVDWDPVDDNTVELRAAWRLGGYGVAVARKPAVAAWEPTARLGEPVEGLALSEWVGQALGAASMCWADVGAAGEFDSSRCGWIFDGLMAHLNAVIAGAGAAGAVGAAPQGPAGPADGFARLTLDAGSAASVMAVTLGLEHALEVDEPLVLRGTVQAALPMLRACWAGLGLTCDPAPGAAVPDGQG